MSKERRLSRIFAKDGKSVTLALDGYDFSTKTNGIDNTINQLPALVEHGLDCALVTYGMLKNYREALNSVPVVLRVDSTVSIFDNTVPDTTPVFSVEDALKVAAEVNLTEAAGRGVSLTAESVSALASLTSDPLKA